jgi:spore photoproduct lyase
LPLGPNPQVIFAWSLNPPEVAREAEHGAAGLRARLQAAQQAAAAGFRLAFHFDPLIYFPGWEEAYRRTVEQLGAAAAGAEVAWVSLGCLRLLPALRRIIMARFPRAAWALRNCPGSGRQTAVFQGPAGGNVWPYAGVAGEVLPGAFIYLCMESPRVWREVFGFAPEGEELARLLDGRLSPRRP